MLLIRLRHLKKAIMKRSELKSKYAKKKTSENLKSFKKTKKFLQQII